MKLSILTPSVPSRLGNGTLQKLCDEVSRQSDGFDVEHLVFLDNKRRTVGEKRDALLRMAQGDFVAFVDDDDWIAPDYVAEFFDAFKRGEVADVITFLQTATVDGVASTVEFKLGNPNEGFNPGGITRRNAWHICAWRRSLAQLSAFPASNYGEDWAWAARLCGISGLTSVHIPKVLHYYIHSSTATEAPPPGV